MLSLDDNFFLFSAVFCFILVYFNSQRELMPFLGLLRVMF